MFFDTHAHYDVEKFDEDRFEVLASMPEKGVELILNPGCDMASSRTAVGFAERFPFVYAAVGVHPQAAHEWKPSDPDGLKKLCDHPKVRAIGEIGLDYYYDDNAPRPVQLDCLEAQLCLAEELGLPVIFHDRDATADSLDAVRRHKGLRGVMHCFSGSWETARTVLDAGWYISFTGSVTFKNAKKAPEAASKMPLDRLMLETDSPYMAPVPFRGRRCDSSYLPYIAARIAELRGLSTEEVAAVTLQNGKRFFGI